MAHKYVKDTQAKTMNVNANVRVDDVYDELVKLKMDLVKQGVVRVSWGDVINYLVEEVQHVQAKSGK